MAKNSKMPLGESGGKGTGDAKQYVPTIKERDLSKERGSVEQVDTRTPRQTGQAAKASKATLVEAKFTVEKLRAAKGK